MKYCLYFILLVIVPFRPLYAQYPTPPGEVTAAAHDGFIPFLTGAVTEETKNLLGFARDDQLDQAKLGTPFQLYYLTSDAIERYDGASPVESVLSQSDLWYFPIIINDRIKLLLYVGKRNGRWMRAGIGSAGLADNLQEITSRWSAAAGYTPLLVQQSTIGVYLFSIPQVDTHNLTETDAVITGAGLGKKTARLSSLDETINNLRARIPR